MILNNFRKKITPVILLLIIISAGAFSVERGYAAPAKKRAGGRFFYPAPKQRASNLFEKKNVKYPFTFIVYGDSREPAGDEKDALIAQIIRERPSFVLHMGDFVLYGEEHQWKIFDFFGGRIIDNGIPIYPVLGNHEYHTREKSYPSDPEEQLRLYFKRFKYVKNKRWYSFRYGNSLFLILDTNTDYSPESYQYKWLMKELKGKAPTFLFIALHHPPYTMEAYKVTRKSEKSLAEIFESYKEKGLLKVDIVFSGHTHNYERYKYNGINYVVSGGGGASQHSIARKPGDLYDKAGKNYHYCRITVSKTNATFEMIRLNENTGEWEIADGFTLAK